MMEILLNILSCVAFIIACRWVQRSHARYVKNAPLDYEKDVIW